ncbi:MAG TPA: alpha/beta hydrolase [Mycobacteriales bacterium]|nr:alpha/beta hydrolase [Mycobacteriales bacterium]
MSAPRRAGLVGALLGVAAAGVAAGLATERFAVGRTRNRVADPYADESFGRMPCDAEFTVSGQDGVDLHVEVVEPAEGEPELTVVFVHGFALDMGTWHFQRRALGAVPKPRVRAVFYDQPGHGRSGRKPSGDYSIDELGEDLAAVIAQVAPAGPLVLAGHSMGGMTIMALAEHHPELFESRVVGIALVSTSAGDLDAVALGLPGPVADLVGRIRRPLTPAFAAALRARPGLLEKGRAAGSDLAYLLTRRYGFGGADVSPSLVRYVEQMNSATPLDVVAGYLRTLSDHERYAALEVFDGIESLLIGGEDDLLTPIEHTEEMARLLPGAEYVEIADGGHVTLMEHADVVNAHLLAFLQRAARALPGERAPETPRRRQARAERAEKADEAGSTERRRLRRVRRRKPA